MNRKALTERIVALLPQQESVTVDEAMQLWWVNPRKTGGYRLTTEGFAILAGVLEFESWTVKAPANLKLLLELDKKVQHPYYVDTKKNQVTLFGSKDAMMASLHGDVRRWLELLDRRSNGSTT